MKREPACLSAELDSAVAEIGSNVTAVNTDISRLEDLDRLYRNDLKSYALVVLNVARDLSRRLRVADGILAEVAGSVVDRYASPRR